ncbi:MAG: trimethylamine methyltransferase family protein [Caldilineales bacterium]|nr:trimethylamine methyltransferase family protein [Caldilineales bacterium]
MRLALQVPEQALDEIVAGALRILAEVGVEVGSEALRNELMARGLRPDRTSGRILFPPDLVHSAISSTPNSFNLFDSEGRPHAEIGGDRTHFTPGSSALHILDHRTGVTRPATTVDFVEFVRLADGLPHLSYLATAFSTNDVPVEIADAWRLFLCLTNSHKPVVSGAFTARGIQRMAEMMALFRNDKLDLAARPLAIMTITATGHFRYGEDSCQNLLDCLDWGIPIEIVPVTLMGLIAPVTPVAAAAFHVADVLAGVTMAQTLRPGHPLLFGGAPAAFHMRTTASPMAAIEAMQLTTLYVAAAKRLGFPTQAYLALGDGKGIDAQAGAETFAGALLATLTGVNSVSGPGMLDYVLVFSLAKLALDDELCGQALHFAREWQADGADSAVELAKVILSGGHLLTHSHTRSHWPEALYLPGDVIDRLNRDAWERAGAPGLIARAAAEVNRRLAAYQPISLDNRLETELRKILISGLAPAPHLPETPQPQTFILNPRSATARRQRPRVRNQS